MMNLPCCVQAAELYEITQDESWSDQSCTTKDDCIPALLKELTVSSTPMPFSKSF